MLGDAHMQFAMGDNNSAITTLFEVGLFLISYLLSLLPFRFVKVNRSFGEHQTCQIHTALWVSSMNIRAT
jgi:hypothetical protein